ncbi:VOC family protein [Oceaniglobus ichthyenteri]|uniref:VOC family protein n=1 Tax=Oceaniglobus ichthyenteri TaxID=2136177 RepID=UPI000D357EC3|nr:VOC family protein [Oceaniglobus ichthyenteri]
MSIASNIKHVHHTALSVRDFDATRAFLVDFLGFEVEGEADRRDEAGLGVVTGQPGMTIRWALLKLGAHRIELFRYLVPEGKTEPPAQCDVGFTHLAFEVDDVMTVYARAIEAGYVPVSPPQTLRNGAVTVFYLTGPDNIVTEYMQFPGVVGA